MNVAEAAGPPATESDDRAMVASALAQEISDTIPSIDELWKGIVRERQWASKVSRIGGLIRQLVVADETLHQVAQT